MQPSPRSIGLPGKTCITLTPALYGGESFGTPFIYLFILIHFIFILFIYLLFYLFIFFIIYI